MGGLARVVEGFRARVSGAVFNGVGMWRARGRLRRNGGNGEPAYGNLVPRPSGTSYA